jgi:hypothetical protein
MQFVSVTHKKSPKSKSSKEIRSISSSSTRATKPASKSSGKTISKTSKSIPRKVSSPYLKKAKRYAKQGVKTVLLSPVFHSTFRVVSAVIIVAGFTYTSYFFISKTFANEVIVSQSEIVARVSKLTSLPQVVFILYTHNLIWIFLR